VGEAAEVTPERNPIRIRDGGWEQGSIVAPVDLASLSGTVGAGPFKDGSFGIVLSQSCDVVASSYEDEPKVEILVAEPIQKSNWQYVRLRNPRIFHMPFTHSGTTAYCELRPHLRFMLPRHLLEDIARDSVRELPPDSLQQVRVWIVDRYVRSALPDEFNNRLKKIDKRLETLFKKKSEGVTGVWIFLNTEEALDAATPYRMIRTVVTMKTELYSDRARRSKAEDFAVQLGKILEDCEGIESDFPVVLPESRFTLDDLGVYQRLDKQAFSTSE